MKKALFDPRKHPVTPYIFSLLIVFVATGLRLWPLEALELRIPWVTYYPAVMASALYAGFRSGLLTTLLSVIVVLFWSFNGKPFIDDPGDWLGLSVFSLNAILISLMGGMMQRAKEVATRLKDEAEEAKSMLEDKVEERTKELSVSEGRLRSLFANSPFPIMVHAENGRVEMINQTWTEITGYSRAEIPTIADWVEKAFGGKNEAVQKRSTPLYPIGNRMDDGEYTIRTRDGNTVIWDFSSASPLCQCR